jgi:hypothetical protein
MPAEPATDGLDDLRAAQRLLQRLVAIADAPASIERLRAAGFDDAGLAPADAAVLAATDVRHLGIYRKLVRRTLRNTIALQLPRTAARLGERYASEIDAFCESELPRSPLLRDVAFEMVRWATPRWQQGDGVEPWLGQLARYELLEFAVYAAERSAAGAERPDAPELDAAAAVCFDGTTRLARFDYAVHELPDDPDDRSLPDGTPAHLLCYRDDDGCFVRIELTPICGELLGRRKVVLGRRPPATLAAPPFAAWLYDARTHAPGGARS